MFLYILNLLVERARAGSDATPPQITPGGSFALHFDIASKVNKIFGNAYNILTLTAGALAVLYLIYNGIVLITSGGNSTRVQSAKQGIINAVIGIVVIVAAYAIIRLATTIAGTINYSI